MMADTQQSDDRIGILVRVVEDTCKSALAQYDDYYKAFVALDGKAQSAATVAGVVMGAVFAFFNASNLNRLLIDQSFGQLLAVAPVVFALLTVIVSVIAMYVRSGVPPIGITELISAAEHLSEPTQRDVSTEQVLKYYQMRLEHTKEAIKSIERDVRAKGNWTLAAQGVLILTLIALLLLFLAIANSPSPPKV